MKRLRSLLFLILLASFSPIIQAQSYKITNRIQLGGAGGWDYLTVDEAAGRLYVSHATEVMVVDLKKNALIGTIPDTKGVHGIALAPDLNKGFISCGRDSSVAVFDLKTTNVTARVKVTGRNPDAILYDPFKKLVFTFNGGSSNSTVLDARTNKIITTIPLAGKPEFSVSDGKGKVYVNIEDRSMLSVINANTLKVENAYSIAPGEEPSGLALDEVNHRLFIVCSNKRMVVMNALSGKVITILPIGGRVDGVAFDPGLKRAYSSNGDGTMTVVQEETPEKFRVLENVPTQIGARTISCDKTTHTLYLPTAQYQQGSTGRSAIKPGSFVILEIKQLK